MGHLAWSRLPKLTFPTWSMGWALGHDWNQALIHNKPIINRKTNKRNNNSGAANGCNRTLQFNYGACLNTDSVYSVNRWCSFHPCYICEAFGTPPIFAFIAFSEAGSWARAPGPKRTVAEGPTQHNPFPWLLEGEPLGQREGQSLCWKYMLSSKKFTQLKTFYQTCVDSPGPPHWKTGQWLPPHAYALWCFSQCLFTNRRVVISRQVPVRRKQEQTTNNYKMAPEDSDIYQNCPSSPSPLTPTSQSSLSLSISPPGAGAGAGAQPWSTNNTSSRL